MSPDEQHSEFYGKTWIYAVRLLVCITLGLFGIILGPLCLFGVFRDVHGRVRTEAGIPLIIFGIAFGLIAGLYLFAVLARREPLIRIGRDGIEVRLIGSTSLDGIPFLPGLIVVAWAIVSGQGFRQTVLFAPWVGFRNVMVTGLPMARVLSINAAFYSVPVKRDDRQQTAATVVYFPEHELTSPPDHVAEVIKHFADDDLARQLLP